MLGRAAQRGRVCSHARLAALQRTALHTSHVCQPFGQGAHVAILCRTMIASSHARRQKVRDFVPLDPVLEGRCSCGKCGFKARGVSVINFITHSSAPRHATKKPFLSACGFKSNQIEWVNSEGIINSLSQPEFQPPGSKNAHYFCASCKDYLGVDATRWLGVVALNTELARIENKNKNKNAEKWDPLDSSHLQDCYRPNHHLFYADRVADVNDGLPKWETVPEGKIIEGAKPTSTSPPPTNDYDSSTGMFRQNVRTVSPIRAPEPSEYHFVETELLPNHVTKTNDHTVQERVKAKYHLSTQPFVMPSKSKFDAIIVGGGHNGLVSAAYLAKNGLDVCVLERRHVVGGAAVSEEMTPGFTFSRASYLAGLLRPKIIADLQLEKHGLKYLPRDPSSFTPTLLNSEYKGKSLVLGADDNANHKSISQFSARDADAFGHYEQFLANVREMVEPLLDYPIPDFLSPKSNWRHKRQAISQLQDLARVVWRHKKDLGYAYELFTGPAQHLLERWFESEILKTTLATDAVIGAMTSPSQAGSAYVLLHHVMGEAAGRKGVWAYVEGGMGAISNAIASSARAHGATIVNNAAVAKILVERNAVNGVELVGGERLFANTVISNATPYHTFLELLPGLGESTQNGPLSNHTGESPLSPELRHHVRFVDYSCGAMKINCAVSRLPDFECAPSPADGKPGFMHTGTVHFESRMEEIEQAYREASMGMPATRPVVEMTIPSSLDRTIAPPGKHVVQFFVQFAPFNVNPKFGSWADPAFKERFADRVFSIVDEFCPNFSSSVEFRDILSPLDLERVFGLHRGNIFHGALSLHQLAISRPAPRGVSGGGHRVDDVRGLYLCGSGTHPGGGVMGAPGKNAASVVLADLGLL